MTCTARCCHRQHWPVGMMSTIIEYEYNKDHWIWTAHLVTGLDLRSFFSKRTVAATQWVETIYYAGSIAKRSPGFLEVLCEKFCARPTQKGLSRLYRQRLACWAFKHSQCARLLSSRVLVFICWVWTTCNNRSSDNTRTISPVWFAM